MKPAYFAVGAAILVFYALLGWLFVWALRKQRGPVNRAFLVLVVLLALDGLFLGQGAFTFLIAGIAIVAQLVFASWRAVKRDWERARAHLAAGGVYLAAIGVVWGYIALNNQLAARAADHVIAACRAYEGRHGQLPKTLDELVPEFLPGVPRAKYTLLFGEFRYWAWPKPGSVSDSATGTEPASHVLEYVVMPPFGRRLYRFEQKSWGYLD